MRSTFPWLLLGLAACTPFEPRQGGGGTAVGNPARTAVRPADAALTGVMTGARWSALRCGGTTASSEAVDVDLSAGEGPDLPGGELCLLTLVHEGIVGDLEAPAGVTPLLVRDLAVDGGAYVLELGEVADETELSRSGLYLELVEDGVLDPVERGVGAVAHGTGREQVEPEPAAAVLQVAAGGARLLRTDPTFPEYRDDTETLDLVDVAFGDGLWVAVGGDADTGTSQVSADGGLTWSAFDHERPLDGVAFHDGRFAATSIFGTVELFDGTTWQDAGAPQLGYKGIAGSELGWLAVAGTDVALSADGTTWQQAALPGVVGFGAQDAAWGAGRFVAVGDFGYRTTSVDGLVWTDPTSGGNTLSAVAFDGTSFLAVGVLESWTSADGVTWAPGPAKTLTGLTTLDGTFVGLDDTGGLHVDPAPGGWVPWFDSPDATPWLGLGSSSP